MVPGGPNGDCTVESVPKRARHQFFFEVGRQAPPPRWSEQMTVKADRSSGMRAEGKNALEVEAVMWEKEMKSLGRKC